jgi:hypothetical protein
MLSRASSLVFLSHCLKAYDPNPVWTADPKRTVYRDIAWRSRAVGGLGSVGEKAASVISNFVLVDMFASYCTDARTRRGRSRLRSVNCSGFIVSSNTGRAKGTERKAVGDRCSPTAEEATADGRDVRLFGRPRGSGRDPLAPDRMVIVSDMRSSRYQYANGRRPLG